MLIEENILAEKTRKLLEFDLIQERLASYAMSEEAAAIIREERPSGDPVLVVQTKAAVQAVISRIYSGDVEPRKYLPSIGFLLPGLDVEGAVLAVDEACAIGLFVERGEELRNWLTPPPDDKKLPGRASPPELAAMTAALPECAEIAAAIFRVIDRDGNLRDLPGIRAIKRRIHSLNAALEALVSRYAANDDIRRMLQSAAPSQRDGRTVLAVKAGFRGRIRGIVHDVSSSGQTVFMEPEDVVEKNNEILIEQRNLDSEIKRIMLNLTSVIAGNREPLKIFYSELLSMEVLMAKARYSVDTRGCFSPDAESARLVLAQARHPLLQDAVPVDLTMDGGISALIITGPNTGGKTVALKTAGLFAMMNQIGIALPAAEGSVLPVFDSIFADIGDEQSIGQSLSTFSAHITNIANIINYSTGRSLALLDELGSGTDPQEGGAIAMAILDRLIEKRARLIVTTHHGVLKNYGYTRQEVENASVEFDSCTLSPMYRIRTGIPGESRALEIAERNGLPPGIVARARNYVDSGHSDVSALIGGLKEKRLELDALTEKVKLEDVRLMNERRQSDLKELRLRQKELELKAGMAGKLRLLLDESRKTLENLVRELREGELSREKTLKVKDFLRNLATAVEEEDAALEAEKLAADEERQRVEKTETRADFAPGMEVFAGNPRRRGTLVRLGKKNAAGNTWLVEIGSLKMIFPERDLVPAAPVPPPAQPLVTAVDFAPTTAVSPEINLCGMRLEDALETLRRQLDAAVLSGLKVFSVIHGKGNGILQKGVHDLLKTEPAVADYYFSRPELGGFGRTEVVLR